MSIHRRLRRRWQDALLAGKPNLAVFRYQVEVAGGDLRQWPRWREGQKKWTMVWLASLAEEFVKEHRLDPGLVVERCVRDERAYAVVRDYVMHRAHWLLGTPYEWRERREEFFMGTMDVAQALVESKLARMRLGNAMTQAMRRAHRVERALQAKALRDDRRSIPDVAEQMGCTVGDVYRLLREAEGLDAGGN